MGKKRLKNLKGKKSKQPISKKKGPNTNADKLAGQPMSAVSTQERFDLRPDNPIRALLGIATRAWELALVESLSRGGRKREETLPDLNELGRFVQRQGTRNLAMLKKKVWTFLAPPAPPQIDLEIEGIEPSISSTWLPDQDVRVGFVVRNNSSQPTSGFVHGMATQGVLRRLVSSGWFQPGAIVTDLPPGQAFIGVLELKNWTGYHRLPGSVDINLEYWVEDRTGTITFVWGLPGNQKDATYKVISFAKGSLGALIGFAADIRPLFRDKDIQAMLHVDDPIDLESYENVKARAADIYDSVAHPTGVLSMPCDGRWSTDWIDTFKLWMDTGMLP